ncbi:histone acetyltransferases subunit 3-domain-containing protein [Hyaloraphidium curvatum]|nr:histone acetyltransferases subunit 3-domain-containing protein [Hyaloraphidium curvatum]
MAAATAAAAGPVAALAQLNPVLHDGGPNEITLTYGFTPQQARLGVAPPQTPELDRIRQSLDVMRTNATKTVRTLQANMDVVGEFLKSQNALVQPASPASEAAPGLPVPKKIKITLPNPAVDKLKSATSSRPRLPEGTPEPLSSSQQRRKRQHSEMLAESAPPNAIYSMRVENTVVHITQDNKMKVIVQARPSADARSKQKNKNKSGTTGGSSNNSSVPTPRRPETPTLAPGEDVYGTAQPTMHGVPLDGDFTKLSKPQNQIPYDQFWRFVDQFWRPLVEDDLAWLQNPGDGMQVYAIPPLGKPFVQQWDEEDRILMLNSASELTSRPGEGSEFRYENDVLVPGDAVLGPFTERTLQALVQEDLLDSGSVASHASDAETLVQPIPEHVPSRTKQDLADLEERIKIELQYIDLAPPHEASASEGQEDEITNQLRRAQNQLRQQVERNMRLKSRIHEVALKWLAYQEYLSVKDELERQIQDAYARRFRTIKKKKKAGERPVTQYVKPLVGDNAGLLIAKRRQWIEKAGPAFDLSRKERQPLFLNVDG